MTSEKPLSLDVDAKIMNIALKDLEKSNGLPTGYLTRLRTADSDWDFIVKIGLVLEAIVARAIALEAGRPLTYKKATVQTHRDRLVLAQKKGLIDKVELRMLETISELRNAFVHRLENLTRTLGDYFSELSPERQKQIAKSILAAGVPGSIGKAKDSSAISKFSDDFRKTVLAAIFPTLLKLGYGYEVKQREKRHAQWRAKQEQLYGRPLPSRTEDYLSDRIMVMDLLLRKEKEH